MFSDVYGVDLNMQIYKITIIVHVKSKSDISLKMRWICSPNANLLYSHICLNNCKFVILSL